MCEDSDNDDVPECTMCMYGYTLRDDGGQCVGMYVLHCIEWPKKVFLYITTFYIYLYLK